MIRIGQRSRIEVELPQYVASGFSRTRSAGNLWHPAFRFRSVDDPRASARQVAGLPQGDPASAGFANVASYRGAEIVRGVEQRLPIGSTLDGERGIFYWAPAPGFLGSYDLVFGSGAGAPIRVRVVIEP